MSPGDLLIFIPYGLAVAGLCLFGLHRFFILYLFLRHGRQKPVLTDRFDELPLVTIQLPIFNERYVVQRLLQAVGELDYPKDRLEIQILDDSTDDTRELCEAEAERLRELGFDAEVLHRTDRTGYKAGALEEGQQVAKGEFFYILDADFVPPPEALQELIHWFRNPAIGMVQTRWGHLNREQSILTRVQSIFLDAHFLLEQTARSRGGRFFHFNGTAGMWRRQAIEDAGGWQHDTLTEDLDLSYRAQLEGWRFIYLNDIVTPAELPADMDGFKSQQHRWTKGSIQTCRKLIRRVWRSQEPLRIKLEATFHLGTHFSYLFAALLCITMIPVHVRLTWEGWPVMVMHSAAFILASLSVVIFYMLSARRLHPGTWLWDILHLPLVLAIGIGISVNNLRAIYEALTNQVSAFIRTPKFGDAGSKARQGLYAPSLRTLSSVLETIFGLWFLYMAIRLSFTEDWGLAPFVAMFGLGFTWVGLPSVRRMILSRS